jgi:hypothetical protein
MDSPKFTSDCGGCQALRRASMARELEDDIDRASDDLAFIIGKVIDDIAPDNLSAYARFRAEETVKDTVREQNRTAKRVLCALLRVLP